MAQPSSTDTARSYVAVTPSDTTILSPVPVAFLVGGAGNVALKRSGPTDTAVVFKGLTAGSILPVRGAIVMATGTNATDIVALYNDPI